MAAAEGELRSLGLKAPSRLALAEKIHKGVSYRSVQRFQEAAHLPEARLQGVTGIPARTWVRRKQQGRFNPDESERIARIARIFDHAVGVFGSKGSATRWLEEANLGLGDRAPLDVASTELGAQEVDDLLTRIEFGVYS